MVAPGRAGFVWSVVVAALASSHAAWHEWRVADEVPRVVTYFAELVDGVKDQEDLLTACNIETVDYHEIDRSTFRQKYEYTQPVILSGYAADHNRPFREQCAKQTMLDTWGDENIVLSTANAHSYEKKHASLRWYIDHVVNAPTNQCSSSEKGQCLDGRDTWYWFGNHRTDFPGWQHFLDSYNLPEYIDSPAQKVAFSFGVGPPFSGVPFHIHGKVFAESIIGRKRWFLAAPDEKPLFHPDESTAQWLQKVIPQHNLSSSNMIMCDVEEGQVLFIPSMWWHSTLNLDESVFISAFVAE